MFLTEYYIVYRNPCRLLLSGSRTFAIAHVCRLTKADMTSPCSYYCRNAILETWDPLHPILHSCTATKYAGSCLSVLSRGRLGAGRIRCGRLNFTILKLVSAFDVRDAEAEVTRYAVARWKSQKTRHDIRVILKITCGLYRVIGWL